MEGWQSTTLDQIGIVITGKTPPTSNSRNYGGEVPFVTPSDMDGRRYIDSVGRYLTKEGLELLQNVAIPSGTVMVSCIGSDMGKAAIAAHRSITNQQINSLIVKEAADPVFIYYNLSTRKAEIRASASGSAQPILNKTAFGKLKIDLPPFPEQRAIAAVLGTLDDKIELNRRMNETLEAMARAIFRDWFVDFGPTRARMEGRAPYLAPEIWSLFPDRLDGDGKPEGWETFSLSQIATQHTATMSPATEPETEFEHFSLPAFDSGQNPAKDKGTSIKSNKSVVPTGAVLLSKLNPEIPRVWLPENHTSRPQICSTEFLVFTPTEMANRSILYFLFLSRPFREVLGSMVTGTSKSHQRVSPRHLLQREVIEGTTELFACFDGQVGAMLTRMLANRAESRVLAETRDLLLPKLMSGEVRVRDASTSERG